MRDVDAWVIGMLGAPVAVFVCSTVAYLIASGMDDVLTFILWQFSLAFLVLMGSMMLSPIPFLISERLGIACSSRTPFRWAVVPLAPHFCSCVYCRFIAYGPYASYRRDRTGHFAQRRSVRCGICALYLVRADAFQRCALSCAAQQGVSLHRNWTMRWINIAECRVAEN